MIDLYRIPDKIIEKNDKDDQEEVKNVYSELIPKEINVSVGTMFDIFIALIYKICLLFDIFLGLCWVLKIGIFNWETFCVVSTYLYVLPK